MEAIGGGKRRLVLPAPPAAKKPALQLAASDQNDAGNWELPGAAVAAAAAEGQHGDQERPAAAGGLSDEDDAALLADLPNDTEAALQLLKSQFKAKGQDVLPFALKSQLYSVLQDRTLVDRQLDELRLRNRVRIFQLPTGPDDYALMLTADYNAALQSAAQQQLAKGALPSLVHVFDWFRERVLPACCEVMLTHAELMRLLGGCTGRAGKGATPTQVVTDAHLSLLINAGFLNRHADGGGAYTFAMPGSGPAVRSIREGRLEIIKALQRRRYPELPEKDFAKLKLQRSVLAPAFHMRDMLGSGALLKLNTTVGAVLRLAQAK